RRMLTSGRQAGWYPTLPPGTLGFFRVRRFPHAVPARRRMVIAGRQAGWYLTVPTGTLEISRMRRCASAPGVVW
ncbi:MAG: hypothetical protein KC518_07845, partial [Candidatus Cloacimonetes bacterium]|nr:hypothetical protein [Candidatus Cloacimonadota bacterium]